MLKDTSRPIQKSAIRQKAERLHSKRPRKELPRYPASLVHELEVHQIELEMQNEELRNARLEAEDSRNKYLDLYDFAPVGYLSLDENGIISGLNLTAARLLGMERKSLLHKPFACFITPKFQDTFYFHRQKVLESSTKQTCDLMVKQNDVTVHVQLDSIWVEANGQRVMHMVLTDITALKRAEAVVHEERDKLSALIGSIQDEVWFADIEKTFTLANQSALREFNLENNNEIDIEKFAESLEVYRPDGTARPVDEAPPLRALTGEVVKNQEELIRMPGSGELRYRQVSASPVRDIMGTIIGSVSVVRDITALKQAEETLQRAHDELELRIQGRTEELRMAYESLKKETKEREQAENDLRQAQKMEALGTLAGGIAHDFNNLLGAVIGFTELILDDLPEGNPCQGHAAHVMKAGIRGRDLVKQMLTFSRTAEQEKKPLRFSGIVEESAKLLRSSIPTTIAMNVNVTSESGLIMADPVHIQQVVMNLCTNAYHAMREWGGTLDIELSDFSAGTSGGDAQGVEPGRYMRLTVHDTGIGIPEHIKDRIFDPFFTTKAAGEGTGLGLSVVMGIVKQSDGYITVESEPGKGSTFSVYFPTITGETIADAAGGEEVLPTGTERILFVDDEEAILEMCKQILTRLGYKVTSQMSSKVAFALIEENPSRFDLVITDQTMPDMAGVELAKKILAIRPDIPVILCTGFSHLVDADSAKAAGIRAVAIKPLTKAEIAKTVRDVLDRKNSA